MRITAATNATVRAYETIRIPGDVFGFAVTRIDPAGNRALPSARDAQREVMLGLIAELYAEVAQVKLPPSATKAPRPQRER